MGQSTLHIATRLNVRASTKLFIERLINASSDTSGPKQLRIAAEAFTPITTSSILTWAQSWGYGLSYVSARASSRAKLRCCLRALIQHVKVLSYITLGEKVYLLMKRMTLDAHVYIWL